MLEEGLAGYQDSIARLSDESGDLMSSLNELKEKVVECTGLIDDERARRQQMMDSISAADAEVSRKRLVLDQASEFRGKLEVQVAEATMRRQNIFDHLQDEYGLFADAVLREPDPVWKDGVVPPTDELEAKVAKLQGEIAALGPVNMVAVDECRELEERYAKEKA